MSYFSFEDKFRFECLSHRIQRLIFNKVSKVKFVPKDTYVKIESVIKKCRNIRRIDLNKALYTNYLFGVIINNCNYLTQVKAYFYWMTNKRLKDFGQKFGNKLKSIDFYSQSDSRYPNKDMISVRIYQLFPKITEISGSQLRLQSLVYGRHLDPIAEENSVDFH